MNVAATASAGLGLFFVGMRLVSAHVRALSGGGVRRRLAGALTRTGVPALAGFISGALTQSTSAVAFIAIGLISAGTLAMPVAVGMLAWASVGTSVLVLLAAIDVKTLVLYLLALTGLGFFSGLEQAERTRHLVFSLLGLGLLLFGLSMLKGAVAEVRDELWMREFVEFAGSGVAVAFLAGFIIAVAVQSSSIVVLLALPLVHEGLLNMDATAMMIFGASVGASVAVALLASGLDGASRQLALCLAFMRTAAVAILIPLYLVERYFHVPLLFAGIRGASTSLSTQAGLLFLIAQLTSVVFVALFKGRIISLAQSLSPTSAVEALGAPKYLIDEASDDATTAITLVRLEYVRLVAALPEFIDDLRPESERSAHSPGLALRDAASRSILVQIEQFLSVTLHANPEMDAEIIFDARRRLTALTALQDSLAQFTADMLSVLPSERPAFANALIEGLHAILGVAVDASTDLSGEASSLLLVLTDERGALLDRVRAELLSGGVSIAGREKLLSATLLFERIVWMLRQLARLPAFADSASAMPAAVEAHAPAAAST